MIHTADLRRAERAEIKVLLADAFEGRYDDNDWDHTCGGLHALVMDDDRVVAHAAVVQRRLLVEGRSVRTGYVEGVAVLSDFRGRGHAAAVMAQAEQIIRAAYDLGALSTSAGVEAFYQSRGWIAWQGPTGVLTPDGIVRTPGDDGSTFVLPVHDGLPVGFTGELVCDFRAGDVW